MQRDPHRNRSNPAKSAALAPPAREAKTQRDPHRPQSNHPQSAALAPPAREAKTQRPPAVAPRRTRPVAAALLVLVALGVLAVLGGCTRVRTALAVQSDDTVAGEIVIATAVGPPPKIVLPPELAGRVTVTPYRAEGYQGAQLQFNGLRFDEVNALTSVAPQANGRFQFALRRSGNLVALNGHVDLTAMPVDRADVQLKVAFPGEVTSTDGELDSDAVSWVFAPGEVTQFHALVNASDPNTPSVARWSLLLGAVVAAAAIGVVLLAKANRNPPARSSIGRGP